MKLSQYSDQDIHELIKAMQNGIAIKPDSEESKSLEISIARAYAELERRAQKKSEQLIGNHGQLEEKGKIQQAAAKVPDEVKQQVSQHVEKKLVDSGWQEMSAVLSAPAKATEQTIPVVLLGWKQPKEMNRSHIRAEARRYFNAVFASAKFKTAYSEENLSALWSMKMYCNLWALCEAYHQLAKIRFEMEDLLQNWWSYTPANQEVAKELAAFLNEPQ
jgi:hypothetical protein